ncbi:MFS transporter [Mangrovactinospora gilvigrisea]|uniref:MFS transporter n=1 Tax=Mangrovactinospora gilvigrisea TaxID=1428644 RepID=A0A1J7CBP9_9ACTN|nr:MFS transporter [Mangrovactinospora gilvigrisea]OIV38944.1 MFS transporter [Mangrovactinospora gilvigrisea]
MAGTELHTRDGATTPGGAAPRAGRSAWAALAVLVLPVLMISVDSTVLGFAVPFISEDLAPSSSQLLWIIDIYSFVLAGLLVTMGTLGDRIGRRRLLLIGTAGFGLASVLAAYAHTPAVLIGARALLGLAGATLMPSTLSIIRNLFADRQQRTLAIAVWGSAFAGGSALGPIVGGWLLEHFWWGSIFLINLPVTIALLIAGRLLLPESRDPRPGRYDLLSAGLSLAAMLPAVYGVKSMAENGVTPLGVGALLVGVALGVVFVRRQLRLKDPMLDMALFRNRTFSVAVSTNLMAVFALVGCLFFLTQYLQLVQGRSPLASGVLLLPGLACSVVASLLVVRLVRRFPLPVLITCGLLVAAAGYALVVTLGAGTPAGVMVAAFALIGSGIGIAETLTNDAILAAVPPERAGAASAISETAYELGAALGTALLGSVVMAVYRGRLAADVPESARETLGGAVDAARHLGGSAGGAVLSSAREAFASGMHVAALVGVVVVVAAAVMAGVLLRKQSR